MSDDKVTIGGALSYAWLLLMENWRAIWGVLAFYALSVTVFYAGALSGDSRLMIAGAVPGFFAEIVTSGAVFRLAFAKEVGDRPDFRLGTLGVQWRGMEWRMLGATGLLALFFVMVGALAMVAVMAVATGVMMAKGIPLAVHLDWAKTNALLGPVGQAAMQLVFFVAVSVMIFFAVRLSLSLVASAVSGRVRVLKSFSLTRGQFWTLFATGVALLLPAFVFDTLLMKGLGDIAQAPAPPAAAFVIALAMGVINAGLLAPMQAGARAYFYRNLRTPA